jgi:MoxR-like ATPase
MNSEAPELSFLDPGLATGEESIEIASGVANLKAIHIFDQPSIHAVNAALASGRPLLVRGEPGIGKSQLALAVAKKLKRVFLSYAVDIQTEAKDLLWHFDSVERLAKAQVAGALHRKAPGVTRCRPRTLRTELAVAKFLHPGVLWWAFDWDSALRQTRLAGSRIPSHKQGAPENGCVILIDEIDKAETDVPNGLLEALGAGQFMPVGHPAPVCAKPPFPLVIITTNEERALPDAFLRRCMVLNLELPKGRKARLDFLVERGGKHFPEIDSSILGQAAAMLLDDREAAQRKALRPLPGQAEYLDILRALHTLRPGQPQQQADLLGAIAGFALRKHGPEPEPGDE